MKGSYWFKAKSKKVLFEFSIRRNITVIKGDSATGMVCAPSSRQLKKYRFFATQIMLGSIFMLP